MHNLPELQQDSYGPLHLVREVPQTESILLSEELQVCSQAPVVLTSPKFNIYRKQAEISNRGGEIFKVKATGWVIQIVVEILSAQGGK